MGTFSIWHWLILLLIVMLLFGGGRISGVMGDVAKGIKSFKKGLADDDETTAGKDPKDAKSIEAGTGGTTAGDAVRREKA